jgi:cell shape-determining protein MreC
MKATRRELLAINAQLSAQLAVHQHETRKGLNARLAKTKEVEKENEELKAKVTELSKRLEEAGQLVGGNA